MEPEGKTKTWAHIEHLAYHEAGHVVVCHLLGHPIISASIVGTENSSGHVLVASHLTPAHFAGKRRYRPETIRKRIEIGVQVSTAGVVAETILTGSSPLAFWDHKGSGSSADMSYALELAGLTLDWVPYENDEEGYYLVEIESMAYTHWLWLKTYNRLRQPESWGLVEAVADALLAKQRLNAKAIHQTIVASSHHYHRLLHGLEETQK